MVFKQHIWVTSDTDDLSKKTLLTFRLTPFVLSKLLTDSFEPDLSAFASVTFVAMYDVFRDDFEMFCGCIIAEILITVEGRTGNTGATVAVPIGSLL